MPPVAENHVLAYADPRTPFGREEGSVMLSGVGAGTETAEGEPVTMLSRLFPMDALTLVNETE